MDGIYERYLPIFVILVYILIYGYIWLSIVCFRIEALGPKIFFLGIFKLLLFGLDFFKINNFSSNSEPI